MSERPILFSGEMVRAILAGQKTVTRRVMKRQPECEGAMHTHGAWSDTPDALTVDAKGRPVYTWPHVQEDGEVVEQGDYCPYGAPGGRLWVRETFYAYGRWETRYDEKKGRDAWHFVDMTAECGHAYRYVADETLPAPKDRTGVYPSWWKRPAIFMPRAASRLTLEIESVRVERVQDITITEVRAEGVRSLFTAATRKGQDKLNRTAFECIWEEINGPRGYGWDANPWVWCVGFHVLHAAGLLPEAGSAPC